GSALVWHRGAQPGRTGSSPRHGGGERDAFIRSIPPRPGGIPLAAGVSAHCRSRPHPARVRGAVIRKPAIVFALVWALVVTCLRSARLPNNLATEHWLIDYRFGFVKRGLIGSGVAVATAPR